MARLISNIEEFRPESSQIDVSIKKLLSEYNLTPSFLISETTVELPKNLKYKSGEFPLKLYWAHNLILSQEVGFDFNNYFGETVTAQLFYLINPLRESFRPYKDAFVVVLKQKNDIIGAYINAGRSGFGSSLSGKTFEEIKGQDFSSWTPENIYDLSDTTFTKNANLTPKEVVEKYIEAMDKDDNSKYQYEASTTLMQYLFINMDNSKLYFKNWEESYGGLSNNTESAKLLKIEELNQNSTENEVVFRIEIDMKVKEETTTASGLQHYDISLIKEGNAGWKVLGLGH